MKSYDEFEIEAEEERFSKRKDRRKPKGKRTVNALYVAEASSSVQTFDDAGLQTLFERGVLTEIVGQLKSGKEATVYLATGPHGLMAAKVYSDMLVRSFKNDQVYRQGRFIGDARIKKAIEHRTRNGVDAQQALWIFHEYTQLWELFNAGIPVPKPMVGPSASDMADAGRVVLMEFIGDEESAAPRLSDVRLSPEEARSAWQQSLDILVKLVQMGKVHGDYSCYNLLWWDEKVIVIDFPQVVSIEENSSALHLLEQDIVSLCKSFKRHGIHEDPLLIFHSIKNVTGIGKDVFLKR